MERPAGMHRPLRLATRGSPLALRQCDLVRDALTTVVPGGAVERLVVSTEGDRRDQVPLVEIGGRGVFVKEVQSEVLAGRADVAVHSAKDLPSEPTPGLSLVAVPARADVRDALVGAALRDLPPGACVATGSVRRRAQLADLRPDLTFTELRGNMARRLDAAGAGGVAAVMVAVAALERLGMLERIAQVLPVSLMLPQAGQGAIALECRADDLGTAALLDAVDDPDAHRCVDAERALLAELGGSCALPFGAYAHLARSPAAGGEAPRAPGSGAITLKGLVASGDGHVIVRAAATGDDPGTLALEVARALLIDRGAGGLGTAGRRDHGTPRRLPVVGA